MLLIYLLFLGNNFINLDQRHVLAIDAAGVTPRVVVHGNGRVEGYKDDVYIDPEEVEELKYSIEAFKAFTEINKNEIIKDFFFIFVCPLKPIKGGFPIVVPPKK